MADSDEAYRLLFDHHPNAMWVYDAETLRILAVNEAAVAQYGFTREELLSMSIADVAKKDGTELEVEVQSQRIRFAGRDAKLVLARDATERRRAESTLRSVEEQLRQAQKMEAIGRLAGGIAHDFNNLLSVVLSYSATILEELPERSPFREDLLQIQRAGEHAATLTRQLLAFSRQQVLKPEVVDLDRCVRRIEPMLRRILGEDIAIAITSQPGLDKVKLDPGQIEQVIMNLAVNARDAMPDGGKLTIECANVMLDESHERSIQGARAGAHVMLSISDTGCGMSRETQARIFEPFFTTKEKGKGTGLGLSTVFGIVQQSNGSIWVYSEQGRGTTFKIYFPVIDRLATMTPPKELKSVSLDGTETILLVEDEDAIRKVVSTLLVRRGYRVIEASSPDEAVQLFEQHGPSIRLLLTDVVMPGSSGRELAEALLARSPSLKVLYMSGYTDDTIVRHGVLEEGVTFLQKPITPSALMLKVREALSKDN